MGFCYTRISYDAIAQVANCCCDLGDRNLLLLPLAEASNCHRSLLLNRQTLHHIERVFRPMLYRYWFRSPCLYLVFLFNSFFAFYRSHYGTVTDSTWG